MGSRPVAGAREPSLTRDRRPRRRARGGSVGGRTCSTASAYGRGSCMAAASGRRCGVTPSRAP